MAEYNVTILGTLGVSEIKKNVTCDKVELINESIVFTDEYNTTVFVCPQNISVVELVQYEPK